MEGRVAVFCGEDTIHGVPGEAHRARGEDVPAVLALLGVSVSHPKARLGGHALDMYPVKSETSTR
jgi:hypothetical protein